MAASRTGRNRVLWAHAHLDTRIRHPLLAGARRALWLRHRTRDEAPPRLLLRPGADQPDLPRAGPLTGGGADLLDRRRAAGQARPAGVPPHPPPHPATAPLAGPAHTP